VERLAHGLGMKTCWVDKDFETCTKNELLTQSDVITIHASIEKDQKPILGEEEFKLIKDGAFIINTSRGEAIDENALKNHLPRLGGFAADTLRNEANPKSFENLRSFDNVIITTHIGGYVFEDLRQTFKVVYEDLKEKLKCC
jgi:phosphoglycerate dehydrogenase-like enzyme